MGPFRVDFQILRGLTWRRVGYTLLATAGFALWTASGNWMQQRYGWNPKPVGIADFFLTPEWGWLSIFLVWVPMFFSQMLALTVADNLRVSQAPRIALLVIALVLGTTVGSAVVVLETDNPFAWIEVLGLVWGGLIALVYFTHRRDEELAAALYAARLARLELQKKTLQSDLQLMQARVEPKFLFNTLRRVRDLHETNRTAADQMLNNLILYLRATLPQMRRSVSTLGQEVQLVQAYLNIERIRAQGRPDFVFDIPDRFVTATFPPMVLLPLIVAFGARGSDGADQGVALHAEACADAGILRLTLTHTGIVGAAAAEIENIRGRLTALYGTEAKLELEPLEPQGVRTTLELPHVAR